ncbi:membrane biogenesis protein [Pasteurellaceae bacterium LFhippo2]|nr:membrane biogenesis protein [Pasteurellaceae bacterium LFhippo2]
MKIKSLVAILLLAVGVSACSTVKKVVYRIDVPQGNYLEQDKIDQVKVGMTPEQVQYLLGTPMLKDMFETHRWDYVFILRKGHEEPVQRTLFVYFDNKGLVSKVDLDKRLDETN